MSADLLRLFLALPLLVFHDELGQIMPVLRRGVSGMRWVPVEQIHMTVHFFGDVPVPEIDRIAEGVGNVAAGMGIPKIRLAELGAFPDMKHVNVLWAGIEEAEGRLGALAHAVHEEVRRLGLPVESRPFKAHATLGRMKKKMPPDFNMNAILSGIKFPLPAAFRPVDRMILYKSELSASGAVHEAVREFPFGGPQA